MSNENEIWETPYAAAVDSQYWDFEKKVCFVCYRWHKALIVCEKCRLAWYCSTECLKRDLEVTTQHKYECDALIAASKNAADWRQFRAAKDLRVLCRILARQQADNGTSKETEFSFPKAANRRVLSDLMTHTNQFKGSIMVQNVWQMFQNLFQFPPESPSFYKNLSYDEFLILYGRIHTNSFSISGFENIFSSPIKLGLGCYLQCSRFDHSCRPDLVRYFDGSRLILRPAPETKILFNQLSAADINKLTISYNCWEGTIAPTADRRESLQMVFHFRCECAMCKDTLSDQIQWSCVAQECPKCFEALVPKSCATADDAENGNAGPKGCIYPALCFSTPPSSTKVSLSCLVCNSTDAQCDFSLAIYYEHMRHCILTTLADTDVVGLSTLRDASELSRRVSNAAETLHAVKNGWLLLARETLLENFIEKDQMSNPTDKNLRDQCLALAESIAISYEFFKVQYYSYPILCAKIGRWHAANKDESKAKFWFEKAKRLWSQSCSPQHHCVQKLEKLIEVLPLAIMRSGSVLRSSPEKD